MEKLNIEEKKIVGYLESLKGAIQDGDYHLIRELKSSWATINWKSIRKSILDEVNELIEAENHNKKVIG